MSLRIRENLPCISKPVDNMKKVIEPLNITKWWRKGQFKYLVVVAKYFFVWSSI